MKKIAFTIIILTLLLAACSSNEKDIIKDKDYSLAMAVLYNYYSSEYKALTHQAFNNGRSRLDNISDTAVSVSKYAVVVDIDETVLDNSPYQAKSIIEKFSYPEGWNEWCNKAIAKPVPGARDFLNHTDSLGFKIFYLSNRKKEFVYQRTRDNLIKAGLPQVDDRSLLLRLEKSEDNPDPSNKESRREYIQHLGYEIVLLAGDNLGDFYIDTSGGSERDQAVSTGSAEFGNKYIVLPNAMYGNWPAAIGLDGSKDMIDSLLNNMSDLY